MKKPIATALLVALASAFPLSVIADADVSRADSHSKSQQHSVRVWGGELRVGWKPQVMELLGLRISTAKASLGSTDAGDDRLALREAVGLSFDIEGNSFAGFNGGSLGVRGGYVVSGLGDDIDLRNFTLRPAGPFRLDVIGADGTAWFYIDRLMYKIDAATSTLQIPAMDLRVSEALAERVGQPDKAGVTVAGLEMFSRVASDDYSFPQPQGSSKWPGNPAPNGGVYEADVFMRQFSAQYVRHVGGFQVYTPSSELINNVSTGGSSESDPGNPVVATVPGDPLGTSKARYAADVAWHQKFTGNSAPYGNDQHPYLIWNLYRIDPEGRLSQVGRSGVKHAFLTINQDCIENPGDGHILGRGCRDTYGVGNNDSTIHMGPRNEIIPATGQWGRCGSVYDSHSDVSPCNGSIDSGAPCSNVDSSGLPGPCTSYAFRMQVADTNVLPSANSGASYLMESWYIVRDDIDIYNTMQTRGVTFDAPGTPGGAIDINNAGAPLLLGPAIDRWVARGTTDPNESSDEIASDEGHGRVAVRVTDLGDGSWRYDYAVANFDFARAVTAGAEPNLRVIRNNGFDRFEVAVSADSIVPDSLWFSDGDIDEGNDWLVSQTDELLAWSSPDTGGFPDNPLNWGTLFSFSFVSTLAPIEGMVAVGIAEAGTPAAIDAEALIPGGDVVLPPEVFADGFEGDQ